MAPSSEVAGLADGTLHASATPEKLAVDKSRSIRLHATNQAEADRVIAWRVSQRLWARCSGS